MSDLRIACFFPSGSEMVCDLGLIDQLVGVSHECDYPAPVKEKPVVVRCAIDLDSRSLDKIDQTIRERIARGQSIYLVDEIALQKVKPNLILTQDLCQVCAPSGNEVIQTLKLIRPKPEILWQTPHGLEDVFTDLLTLGQKTGTLPKAQKLVDQGTERIAQVRRQTQNLPPLRVFFMEWIDPLYCGGHWIPEMITWAGAIDSLSKPNSDSIRIPWKSLLEWDPEVLIVSPCGYHTEESLRQAQLLKTRPGWNHLKAVQNKRVYAVNGHSYFARPGLRLVDGVEMLAHLFHPEIFSWKGLTNAFAPVLL